MYTFGMLGSYFSQGVDAVAQGAVDIIVVQQEDGTFKSSPWYVKCGDFQGVVKRREKIVNISVNGVQADFYMLLNNKGEAYFEKELEDAPLALPSASSSADDKNENEKTKADDTKQNGETKGSASSKSVSKEERSQVQDATDADSDASTWGNQMSGLLGDLQQEGPSGMWEPPRTVSGDNCDLGVAELSDLKTVSSDKRSNPQDVAEVDSVRKDVIINRGTSISNLMDVAGSFSVTAEERLDLWEAPSIRLEVNPRVISIDGDNFSLVEADDIFPDQLAKEKRLGSQQVFNIESDVETAGACHDGDSPHLLVTDDGDSPHLLVADYGVLNVKTADACTDGDSPSLLVTDDAVLCNLKTVIAEDWFGLQKAPSSGSGGEATCTLDDLDNSDAKAMDEVIWNDYKIVTAQEEKELQDALNMASVVGVCIDGDSWKSGIAHEKNAEQVDSSIWISDGPVNEDMSKVVVAISEDNGLLVNEGSGHTSADVVMLDKEIMCKVEEGSGHTSTDNVILDKEIVCKVEEGFRTEGSKDAEIPTIAVVPPLSRWTMWPLSFRRSRVDKPPVSEATVTRQALLAATKIAIGSPLTEEILRKNGYYEWPQKPKLRTYVPTSGQIESLKLKEGPNKVNFTFPRVLRKTQVDAHIYLWKWNTRIVISDVDGTITKSDVLGQVMPLVGRDWSQSGVTRLFSAIKENGYEVLFLSARAISQAYLTRQFLVNLKQDGEALPKGPVFISPDGLIPSLYREVIRRTPHEFKISCLEEIRRLFPSDVNPFYAGFGNRDTDEISYRKVGIPRGKIFIINPKGEVMVNHHVDVKSYTSIHALVDGMFPPVPSSEQEDFNCWNFWKLPLPDIVDELSAKSSKKTKKGGSTKK